MLKINGPINEPCGTTFDKISISPVHVSVFQLTLLRGKIRFFSINREVTVIKEVTCI